VSGGPPPVPGGRTPEEREAARREREARRAAKRGGPVPEPAAVPEPPPTRTPVAEAAPSRDWLEEARRLTAKRRAAAASPTDRRHPRWSRIVAAVAAALVGVAVLWFLASLFQPFKGEGEGQVQLTIPEGSSTGDIAELLEERGVISSSGFFQLRARLSGRSDGLKPGRYDLKRDMSYVAVLDVLERGVPDDVVQLTIPEGNSRREVAEAVGGQLRGDYITETRRSDALDPREYGAEGAKSLEGFLFPATYELKKGQHMRDLVEQQLSTFRSRFEGVDMSKARRKNLTPYDVLIIASLVEREAAVAKERPLIASVIYNRLKNDIRLDIDATVRFVTGNWDEPLRQSELANPSPYNTRVHAGLPPGPIGNPGIDSIKAAANPANTDYLFYVVKPGTCGRHNFAATDAEFQRYVDEYNREREARGGKSPTDC
jgi:peptidoglycan lytic transglycosylase G